MSGWNFPRVRVYNLHIYCELAEQDLFSSIKAQLFLSNNNNKNILSAGRLLKTSSSRTFSPQVGCFTFSGVSSAKEQQLSFSKTVRQLQCPHPCKHTHAHTHHCVLPPDKKFKKRKAGGKNTHIQVKTCSFRFCPAAVHQKQLSPCGLSNISLTNQFYTWSAHTPTELNLPVN